MQSGQVASGDSYTSWPKLSVPGAGAGGGIGKADLALGYFGGGQPWTPTTSGSAAPVRQALDHSTVSLSREMSETYAIPGPDGQLKATVEDSATVRVRIDVCPNEQGVVKGRIDTLSETTFTGISGPDYHALYLGSDDLSVQVTDTAQVGPVQHTQEARRQATGRGPCRRCWPRRTRRCTTPGCCGPGWRPPNMSERWTGGPGDGP